MIRKCFSRNKGFTLLELLLVFVIIAVLIAMALRYYASVRSASDSTQAKRDLQFIEGGVIRAAADANISIDAHTTGTAPTIDPAYLIKGKYIPEALVDSPASATKFKIISPATGTAVLLTASINTATKYAGFYLLTSDTVSADTCRLLSMYLTGGTRADAATKYWGCTDNGTVFYYHFPSPSVASS